MINQQYLKQQKQQQSSSICDIDRISRNQVQVHISQSLATKYYQILELSSSKQIEKVKRQMVELISPIKYVEEQQDYSKINVKVLNHSAHYQFIEIEVRIWNFYFPSITIAYFETQSPTHKCQTWKKGGFSRVYFCQHSRKKMAIKCCIKTNVKNWLIQNLDQVVTEYCLQKLASSMGIGPKVLNYLGYQIAIYSNCMQFAMEICQQFQNHPKEFCQVKQQLRQNILKMHSLQFVHLDIKLENILFSPSANKFVLSDFGFSLILKQPIGKKTKTQFKGSLTNCSQEMLNLYLNDNPIGEIDLYANDLQCLQKTLESIKVIGFIERNYEKNNENQYYQNSWLDISSWHRLHLVKYYCFMRSLQPLKQYSQFSSFKDSQWRQLLEFINGLWNKREVIKFLFSQRKILSKQIKPAPHNTKEFPINHILNLRSIIHINKYSKSYLMQQLRCDPKQVYRILSSRMQVSSLPHEAYLLALSKSIDLSARPLETKEIATICGISKQFLKINQKVSHKVLAQAVIIAEVSLFLFKHSLQKKLLSFYANIFINTANNIFLLNLLTPQEIIKTLYELLQIKLAYQKKSAILLAFCSALRILLFESEDQSLSPHFFIKVDYILQIFFQDKIYTTYKKDSIQFNTYLLILYHGFRRRIFPQCDVDLNLVDRSMIKDLILYYMLSRDFNLEDAYYDYIMMIVQFKENVQQVKFGYFHYYIMEICFTRQITFASISPLLQNHNDIVLLDKKNHWKIIKNIYENLIQEHLSYSSCKAYFDYLNSFKDAIPIRFNMLLRFIPIIAENFQYNKAVLRQFCSLELDLLLQKWTDIQYDLPQRIKALVSQGLKIQSLILKKYVAKFHIFYRFTYFSKAQLQEFARLYRLSSSFHLQQPYITKMQKGFYLNMMLVNIFVLSNQINKALDLFRKLYLIAKAVKIDKIYNILGENLRINFWIQYSIFLRIRRRFIEFKDYYLLLYEHLTKSNQLQTILKSEYLIEGLLYSFYCYTPQKLLGYTKFLTNSLRKFQSRNLALNVIHIYQRLFLQKDIQSYVQSHKLIMSSLSVEDNPYNIIPLFITFLYTDLSSLRYIYQCFYRAQSFVPIIVRDYILLYIHLERENRIGKSRKVKFLEKINNYYGFHETTLQTVCTIVKKFDAKALKKASKREVKSFYFLNKLEGLISNVRYKNSISILNINCSSIKIDARPLKINLRK